VHTSVIARGFTIAGVAIGSALLIGALAVAMRGLAPTPSTAAADTTAKVTLRTFDRPAHNLIGRLAAWRPPHTPKVHRQASAPMVVTVTAPPTVIPAAPAAAPMATASSTSYDSSDDQQGTRDE
jgi:hypothetical protein